MGLAGSRYNLGKNLDTKSLARKRGAAGRGRWLAWCYTFGFFFFLKLNLKLEQLSNLAFKLHW